MKVFYRRWRRATQMFTNFLARGGRGFDRLESIQVFLSTLPFVYFGTSW